MATKKISAPEAKRDAQGRLYVIVLEAPDDMIEGARFRAVTVPAKASVAVRAYATTPRGAIERLLTALGETSYVPHGKVTRELLRAPWKGPGQNPGGRPARAADGTASRPLTVGLSEGERQHLRARAARDGVTEADLVRTALRTVGVLPL